MTMMFNNLNTLLVQRDVTLRYLTLLSNNIMNRMNNATLLIIVIFSFLSQLSVGQIPDGAKAAPTNIRSNDCPCIFSDNRVMFKVNAPDAAKVQVDLGKLYDMQKDDKGMWTVTTDPQDPG